MGHFLTEEWKEFVPEVENKYSYLVSNLGRVKRYIDKIEDAQFYKGTNVEGYPYLSISKRVDGKSKTYQYSFRFMVASLFLEKDNEDQNRVINLDYEKANNRVDNLKWVTYKEMREHGYKSPYVAAGRKRRFEVHGPGNTKLTTTQVIRLKKKILDPNRKTRLKILAKQFGISEMQLHRIKTGENWGHIKIDDK